jgi:tagaturonate reductase
MKELNRVNVDSSMRKEKVLMFGEGNFLRAFAAFLIQKLNDAGVFDGGIVVLQGTTQGTAELINNQQGLYHVIERGMENGKVIDRTTLINIVNRCINPYTDYKAYLETAKNPDLQLIISNTTEFGICYSENENIEKKIHENFPAKLTDFLHKRFLHFKGAMDKGLVILPCELIDKNADMLKSIVLRYADEWNLGKDFKAWLNNANLFANTLVDRIVSGYPKNEASEICKSLGYEDKLLDVCEPFFLWAIEADSSLSKRLPLDKSNLDVIITKDLDFYRTRKVRILNGAHTMSVLAGHLSGLDTVEHMVKDRLFEQYIQKGLFEEIIPAMQGEGLEKYALDVIERFLNPYLNHKLLSIALNSISKFKSRVLPSIKDYAHKFKTAPKALSFSLAALIQFYMTGLGSFVNDEKQYVDVFFAIKEKCKDDINKTVTAVLDEQLFWGEKLTAVNGLADLVTRFLGLIRQGGVRQAIEEII